MKRIDPNGKTDVVVTPFGPMPIPVITPKQMANMRSASRDVSIQINEGWTAPWQEGYDFSKTPLGKAIDFTKDKVSDLQDLATAATSAAAGAIATLKSPFGRHKGKNFRPAGNTPDPPTGKNDKGGKPIPLPDISKPETLSPKTPLEFGFVVAAIVAKLFGKVVDYGDAIEVIDDPLDPPASK